MSKFFKPEDFLTLLTHHSSINTEDFAATIANEKLEREGVVVYDCGNGLTTYDENYDPRYKPAYRALLINIQPIERCKHPKEKVQIDKVISQGITLYGDILMFFCECGVRVEPNSFEEVK